MRRVRGRAMAAAGLAAAIAIGLGNAQAAAPSPLPWGEGGARSVPGEGLRTIGRAPRFIRAILDRPQTTDSPYPLTPALSPWERESGCGSGLGLCVRLAQSSNGGGALADFTIAGDAIPAPLAGLIGDAARGLSIIRDRTVGNCLICHALPLPDERFQGEIGPALGGVGARLSPGQIRLRLVDQARINPQTVMPAYYRVDGLTNVAAEYRGRPALAAQQIEDVVAYLAGLKE